MRRLCLLVFLALPVAARGEGNLYFLGVAINQAPDKSAGQTIDAWDYCADNIERVFREQAKPLHRGIQVRQILGAKATHAAVMEGLAWLMKSATKDDTVVLYIGSHGGTDAANGWSFGTADGKTLWAHEIKPELGRIPCHVIVMISACTAGGFAHPHQNDPPLPPNVTALLACSARQSTYNQIDIAVAEALCGRADFNHDGVIELDELVRYIPLRYKEWWPDARTTEGSETPVIVKAKTMPGSLALTKVSAEQAAVVHEGKWYAALMEKHSGDHFQVHLFGYAEKPGPDFLLNSVTRDSVCLPSDGRPMLVEQNGRWYPARLLRKEGEQFKVHYIGYKEEEVVAKNRIFYPFVGDPENTRYPYVSAGEPGTWGRLGTEGAWKETIAGTVFRERLYTVETDGSLYITDLSNGTWKQIGKAEFGTTAWMFAAGDSLYTIEKDGNLYRVNPKNGSWVGVGPAGAWKETKAAAVLKDQLYTVETSGNLYVTDPTTGTWQQIGKPEFGNTVAMYAAGEHLYTIETDGSLYRVSPKEGSWSRVGPAGEWKGTRVGAVLKNRLYTVEANGCLYMTQLGSGRWQQIGKQEFGGTIAMFGAGDRLFTIEKDGSLYWVSVK